VLRWARRRLPAELRAARHDEELVPELKYILFDKYANEPVVGLYKGFRFAIGHVRGAKRLARESGVGRSRGIPWNGLLVLRVRRHWACLLRVLLQTVGIVTGDFLASRLVSGVANGLWLVQSLPWYIAVLAVLRLALKVLEWWTEVVVVTDQQFVITSGGIMRKNSMIPITNVTDMSFLRPVIGQVLGYGTLRVESAGQKQDLEKIEYLPRPEKNFPGDLRDDLQRETAEEIEEIAVAPLRCSRSRGDMKGGLDGNRASRSFLRLEQPTMDLRLTGHPWPRRPTSLSRNADRPFPASSANSPAT
jgi:membrane protein YdbS with pleckstrin-like domain